MGDEKRTPTDQQAEQVEDLEVADDQAEAVAGGAFKPGKELRGP